MITVDREINRLLEENYNLAKEINVRISRLQTLFAYGSRMQTKKEGENVQVSKDSGTEGITSNGQHPPLS